MITAIQAKIVSDSITSTKSKETIELIDKLIRDAANQGKKSVIVNDITSEAIALYLQSLGYKAEIVSTSYNTPIFLKIDW